jgi:hypothetical protein
MTSKGKAILVLLIVIAGGAAGAYVFLNMSGGSTEPTTTPTTTTTTTTTTPGPVDLVDTPSPFSGDAWINEVHMNSTLSVDEEYFEIYIPDSYSESSITGWIVTTFDEEDRLYLPTITNVDAEDYIAVYSGTGTEDLNASDGTAIVYLGLSERILDSEIDSIGVFDSDGNVIDFMRYAKWTLYDKSHTDPIYDGWPSSDDGPLLSPSHSGSLSLFGEDQGNSGNWLPSEPTPGAPNRHVFYTTGVVYPVSITSGINKPFTFTAIDDITPAYKNETINILPAPGINNNTIEKIKEYINFSLNFYDEKGFDKGPKTDSKGRINITVTQGATTETCGATGLNGAILIELGTQNSSIDLKYVCEHELMHSFQVQTEIVAGDIVNHAPLDDRFFIEGEATYWGIESTKANFNLNDSEIQKEFDRIGDHNWFDHYLDLNRTIFKGWGGEYSDYIGSYLFMKFIKEKYGEDKLKDAFDEIKDNLNNNSKDVGPREGFENATGKSWDTLLGEFFAWLMTDAIKNNGLPPRNAHITVTYNNDSVGDSTSVSPYASVVERIKVNDTKPFNIDFQNAAGSTFKITIIYVYADGSRSQAFNTPYTLGDTRAPFPVDPSKHDSLVEVLIIKTNVKDTVATINMTTTPINHTSRYDGEEMLCGNAYLWDLPPDGVVSKDHWPWRKWWWFEYAEDIVNITMLLEFENFDIDSFFDVFFEIDGIVVENITNIPAQSEPSFSIPWDPDGIWDFGIYYICLQQSTWNSSATGTLTCLSEPKIGSCFECPEELALYDSIVLNSTEWRSCNCHYFHISADTTSARIINLWMESSYRATANWYMELYNPSNSVTPILSTQGSYASGQWPRILVIPTLNHPYRLPGDEYILKVVYEGVGQGAIRHWSQPRPGTNVYECVPYSPGDHLEAVWYHTGSYWASFNLSEFDDRHSYYWQLNAINWTMKLYDESLTLINDTAWFYPASEAMKALYIPKNETPQVYYLEIVFNGTEISGYMDLILGSMIPGAFITNPIWHIVDTTQYLGITLPYTQYGAGAVYINTTVPLGSWCDIFVNASGLVEVWVDYGEGFQNSTYYDFDDYYYFGFETISDIVSIMIIPKTLESAFALYLWTAIYIG